MNLLELLALALRVKAGLDALTKYGVPQTITGIRYKGDDYQIVIGREES